MNAEASKEKKYEPYEIKNILKKKIEDLKTNTDNNAGKVFRFEFRTEKTDIISWLKLQDSDSKIYFSGREEESAQIAGTGISAVFFRKKRDNIKNVFEEFGNFLENFDNSIRFYGGVSYTNDPGSGSEWDSFGSVRFILPRFEYLIKGRSFLFAANYMLNDLKEKNLKELKLEIDKINFSCDPLLHEDIVISSLKFLPAYSEWEKLLERYLKKIRSEEIKKIVAVRRTEVIFEKDTGPFTMLRELAINKDNSAAFLFSFGDKRFFTGSTPERLFLRKKDVLATEALAGTCPRGETELEDIKLGEELLSSSKEIREQEFVVGEISDKLKNICTNVNISEKKLLKLSTLQHLYNKIDGRLKPGILEPEILSGLFPTSAVSGLPNDIVMKIQKENEHFERGWYSGLIGFVGRNESDLYVAIRSSLFSRKSAFFYSGAGIVKGSKPGKEWEEINLKIRKLMRIFNNEI